MYLRLYEIEAAEKNVGRGWALPTSALFCKGSSYFPSALRPKFTQSATHVEHPGMEPYPHPLEGSRGQSNHVTSAALGLEEL